jgi:hypothetical protein
MSMDKQYSFVYFLELSFAVIVLFLALTGINTFEAHYAPIVLSYFVNLFAFKPKFRIYNYLAIGLFCGLLILSISVISGV